MGLDFGKYRMIRNWKKKSIFYLILKITIGPVYYFIKTNFDVLSKWPNA